MSVWSQQLVVFSPHFYKEKVSPAVTFSALFIQQAAAQWALIGPDDEVHLCTSKTGEGREGRPSVLISRPDASQRAASEQLGLVETLRRSHLLPALNSVGAIFRPNPSFARLISPLCLPLTCQAGFYLSITFFSVSPDSPPLSRVTFTPSCPHARRRFLPLGGVLWPEAVIPLGCSLDSSP